MNGKYLLVLFCSFPALAVAQDRITRALTPELVEIWEKHAVKVDGAVNPSAIPYGVVMEAAFRRFAEEAMQGEDSFRGSLRARFTATDADVQQVAEIAAQGQSLTPTVKNDSAIDYDAICQDILSKDLNDLDALSVALRLEAVAQAEAERFTSYYRDALAGLSAAARSGLVAYVDTEIRPRMRWGYDLVGLASEVPLAFLSLRKESCHQQLSIPVNERAWQQSRTIQTVVLPEQD